jgi:hypothetical protein
LVYMNDVDVTSASRGYINSPISHHHISFSFHFHSLAFFNTNKHHPEKWHQITTNPPSNPHALSPVQLCSSTTLSPSESSRCQRAWVIRASSPSQTPGAGSLTGPRKRPRAHNLPWRRAVGREVAPTVFRLDTCTATKRRVSTSRLGSCVRRMGGTRQMGCGRVRARCGLSRQAFRISTPSISKKAMCESWGCVC